MVVSWDVYSQKNLKNKVILCMILSYIYGLFLSLDTYLLGVHSIIKLKTIKNETDKNLFCRISFGLRPVF